MSQDFAFLYLQLGLQPDCSLEDLKRAYRVRVAELHPDRHLDRPASSEINRTLTELTALYSGAIRFHRIHGRLPGSVRKAPAPPQRVVVEPAPAQAASPAPSRSSTAKRENSPGATPKIAVVSVLVLVVVMVVLHWSETAVEKPAAHGAMAATNTDAPHLELGMQEVDVIALQGPPERTQDDVWNYGSSWVRFEDGHVVDWASEPPNRLRTATPRPVIEEEDEAP